MIRSFQQVSSAAAVVMLAYADPVGAAALSGAISVPPPRLFVERCEERRFVP